jgi:hypothetical protein
MVHVQMVADRFMQLTVTHDARRILNEVCSSQSVHPTCEASSLTGIATVRRRTRLLMGDRQLVAAAIGHALPAAV